MMAVGGGGALSQLDVTPGDTAGERGQRPLSHRPSRHPITGGGELSCCPPQALAQVCLVLGDRQEAAPPLPASPYPA